MPEELLSPVEKEYDLDDRDDELMYDEMIDECYGEFMNFLASRILKECDPIAYRCGFNDYVDSLPRRFYCPICDKLFEDDEDGAKYCCQTEPESEEQNENTTKTD